MMHVGARSFAISLLVIAFFALGTPANADFINPYVIVEVSNSDGTATFQAHLPPQASEKAKWRLAGRTQLRGGPNNKVIATLEDLTVTLDGDPQASIAFAVTAGNSPTNFSISSSTVAFAPLLNPLAKAFGGVTLTDDNLNGDARLLGNSPNGKIFYATYNGSTVFKEELGDLIIFGGAGSSDNGNPPLEVINASVTDITAKFAFTLSSEDSATGSGTFYVVPEPASVSVLVGGTLLLLRRRRR